MSERLIERLVAEARPVRRLWPPALRAAAWLVALAVLGGLATALGGHADRMAQIGQDTRLQLETAAMAATAIAAVLAAFHLAVPGHGRGWLLAPLPFLALWLAVSGYGCLGHGLGASGVDCYLFLLGVGAPVAASLFLLLRRAAPLAPTAVGLMGALGAAASAAALLQFFHPSDVTWLDLGVHALAVLSLLALARAGSRWLAHA